MSIHVACSSCDKEYTLDDSMRGKKAVCRVCKSPFDVPVAIGGERREEVRPAREERIGAAPPPRESRVRARRDEEEAPRRAPAERSRDRERDEEEPSRERRPERKRREKAPSNNNLVLILAGVGGVAVLFISLVVGGLVLAFSGRAPTSPQAAAGPVEAEPVVPAGPVPGDMAVNDVQKVKQATAYLRVTLRNGAVAQGSGFFALERGIVITNAHVLGMLRADSRPPRNVDVVINSGEPGEMKMTGAVLGVDRTNDLAVLRVEGDLSRLPAPLPVDTATTLTETQKVYIFGFPFGAQLGKSITVSQSTIASLRREGGVLKQLQVNGGMHPGNSGGPVTDARGIVVGVSVAGIAGTQINFAIPGDFVKQVRIEGNSLVLPQPPPGPVVNNPPAPPIPARPDAPDKPIPARPDARGSSLLKDLAALRGTWQSIPVNAEGGGATGTMTMQLRPVAGKLGGHGKIDIATKQRGRTTTSGREFNFTLTQQGDNRFLIAPGLRGTGLAFVYTFDGDQLVLSGKVVSRTIAYTLTRVALRRVSANVDLPAADPTRGGGPSSPAASTFTGDVFSFAQSAVQEKRLADVDVRGFTLSKDRYRDVPDEGAVLIGFQVGLGKFASHVVVNSLRPIFLTKTGEKFGQWQGPAPATPTTVKARAGYLVSGMSVRTGLVLNSLTLTFAKLGKDGLDLTDVYNSEAVGGATGGNPGTIGGKGALFVGVTGHLNNERGPCSIGLVAALSKK